MGHSTFILTKCFKCLAATNPSPPLLPGPQQTKIRFFLDGLINDAIGKDLATAHATLSPN